MFHCVMIWVDCIMFSKPFTIKFVVVCVFAMKTVQ